MKRIFIFIVPSLFFLSACGGGEEAPAETSAVAPEPVDAAVEDDVILRLSGDLIANPQTQAEKDRNLIVNYAIDSLFNVRPTQSGLYYQVLQEGQGEPLQWGDKIKVNYLGYFLDNGKIFDSSYRRGKPMEFYIGNMIDGWNEGLQLLRPGAKALFLVPSGMAYGPEGVTDSKGDTIVPANKVLAFELEVVEVTERKE